MLEQLNVSICQIDLVWENIKLNITNIDSFLKANINQQTDLIILPEMFSTGFTMQPQYFYKENMQTALPAMQLWAKQFNALIVGSLIASDNGIHFYNRLYFVLPDGTFSFYNKKHLFTMGNETEHYTSGIEKKIIDYKGWRICGLVCYDLRFPVWSRNTAYNYDLLIYVANWPTVRSYAWQQLLKARAIENQAYVIGCNRIGVDSIGNEHNGCSALLDFKGYDLIDVKEHEQNLYSYTLQKLPLNNFRNSFPVMNEDDLFELN